MNADTKQRIIRIACGVGFFYFAFAVLLWLLGFIGALWSASRHGASHIHWPAFLPSLPAVGLLIGFYFAFRISRTRPITAAASFAALLLASAAAFRYDLAHERYQVQTFGGSRGCGHLYVTWFWW